MLKKKCVVAMLCVLVIFGSNSANAAMSQITSISSSIIPTLMGFGKDIVKAGIGTRYMTSFDNKKISHAEQNTSSGNRQRESFKAFVGSKWWMWMHKVIIEGAFFFVPAFCVPCVLNNIANMIINKADTAANAAEKVMTATKNAKAGIAARENVYKKTTLGRIGNFLRLGKEGKTLSVPVVICTAINLVMGAGVGCLSLYGYSLAYGIYGIPFVRSTDLAAASKTK